jgi:hypothetical protein
MTSVEKLFSTTNFVKVLKNHFQLVKNRLQNRMSDVVLLTEDIINFVH